MIFWDGIVAIDMEGRGYVTVFWILREICSKYKEENPRCENREIARSKLYDFSICLFSPASINLFWDSEKASLVKI